jgi:hypothetical protein
VGEVGKWCGVVVGGWLVVGSIYGVEIIDGSIYLWGVYNI